MSFPKATSEETARTLEMAREARRANAAARRASTLRRDFADMGEWERLAREAGLRLPPLGTAVTPAGMRRWLWKLGLSVTSYYAWAGERTLEDFGKANPDWPLRAWAGLVIEHADLIGARGREHDR